MRRAAPPQQLRIDPTDPGPWSQVGAGPRGLGLVATSAPDAPVADEHVELRPARGVPFATHEAAIVNEGAIVLTAAPGVARTIRLPDMANLFDRRPPGLHGVAGAPGANAGLLADAAGWRAVVLPSMGDLVADLGPGPVAIRGDGRRVAVGHAGAVFEVEIPGAGTVEHSAGGAEALAYGHDGELIVARDGGIGGTVGSTPVTALVTAHAAPRAATLHADASTRIWDTATGTCTAEWTAPPGTGRIALSPDGRFAAIGWLDGDTPVAAVARTGDGALVRRIVGARVIAFDPADRGIIVGGDWGAFWMEPPREAS